MKKLLFIMVLGIFLLLPNSAKAIEANPLSHLEVQTNGGQGNFDLSSGKKTFGFTLTSTIDYATIIATPTNEAYTIEGAGKIKCENGLNKLDVVVTDPSDNSSVTYTINLKFNRVDSLTDDNGNPRTGTFLDITIVSGLALGGLLLVRLAKNKKIYNI